MLLVTAATDTELEPLQNFIRSSGQVDAFFAPAFITFGLSALFSPLSASPLPVLSFFALQGHGRHGQEEHDCKQ